LKRGRLLTIGSFDGVHVGHAELLKTTAQEAAKRQVKSLALTFRVPPKMVLSPVAHRNLLNTPEEKEILLKRYGINEVCFIDFDKEFAQTRPFGFFKETLLRRFGAKGIVVGADFRFGTERSAGALELVHWGEEFSVPVWVISPVRIHGQIVSSTRIRELLLAGNYRTIPSLLGHPYLIEGLVIPGRGLGRKLGFPTANLKTEPHKILPGGIFAVRGGLPRNASKPSRMWLGVCNIGSRPTVTRRREVVVEVHFLSHVGDLKGKPLVIELCRRLRSEKRFDSTKELTAAIGRDVQNAREYFRLRGAKS